MWTLYIDDSSELTIEKLGEYYPQLSKSDLEYLHEEVLCETGQEILKRIDARWSREMVDKKDTYHVRHMESLKLKLEA
jgi:AAA+ ATPase superfamily predicted ATPase